MEIGKLLIIGGLVGGGAYLLMKHANSQAASGAGVPPGWTPPAGAIIKQLDASVTPVGKPLTLASWPAAANQPAGSYMVIWDATDSQKTFAALFYATQANGTASSVPAVLAKGSNPNSDVIIAQLAAISVAVQQSNVTASTAAPATAGWR